MSIELSTLAPKKWSSNYGGNRPTLDSSNGINVGDIAIDTSTTPNLVWNCEDNTLGFPLWTKSTKLDVSLITSNSYSAKTTDVFISANCSNTNITINLPALSGLSGKVYYIKKTDSSTNIITVDANNNELIDGQLTQVINSQYDCMEVINGETEWNII